MSRLPAEASPAAQAPGGRWSSEPSMPTAGSQLAVATVNGQIYAVGGADGIIREDTTRSMRIYPRYRARLESYDPAIRTWAERGTGRTTLGPGAAELNGALFVAGGANWDDFCGLHVGCRFTRDTVDLLRVFDPGSATWTLKRPMAGERARAGVAAVNGKLYVAGGFRWTQVSRTDWTTTILDTVEEYDPSTDTWRTRHPMPTARSGLGLAALGGKLYAVGGETSARVLDTVEEYDPATDTWTRRPPIPSARAHLGVAAYDGRVYAIGGTLALDHSQPTAVVEAYDPGTATWTGVEPMPTARFNLGVAVAGGKLYAIGGSNTLPGSEPGLATVEAYELTPPHTSTPTATPTGTETPSPSATATATATQTPAGTATSGPTVTAETSATPTPSSTATPTPSSTPSPSATATATATPTIAPNIVGGDDDADNRRDRRARETAEQRHQREATNRSGLDDIATEGDVVEVGSDADGAYLVLANRDGLVTVRLVGEAATVTVRVGDYVQVEGEK